MSKLSTHLGVLSPVAVLTSAFLTDWFQFYQSTRTNQKLQNLSHLCCFLFPTLGFHSHCARQLWLSKSHITFPTSTKPFLTLQYTECIMSLSTSFLFPCALVYTSAKWDNSACPIKLWKLNEVFHVKHLKQWLAHNNCSTKHSHHRYSLNPD